MMQLQPWRPQRGPALHHVIAILIVALGGVAHAQAASGCLGVYVDPQKRFLHNEAPAAAATQALPAGTPLGAVPYKPRG